MDKEKKEQQENSYEFLRETIKEKPVDKRKLIKHIGHIAGAGIVFGLAAAVAFSLALPHLIKGTKQENEENQVQFLPEEKEESRQENIPDKPQPQMTENTNKTESSVKKEEIQELTPKNYRELYSDILSTADEVRKSLVTVNSSQNDKDWFQTPYERQISGLLVAESGQDYFVLTEYRIVENVDRIQIVFCDGEMTDARFQKADKNTGFAVLKIPKTGVPDSTKQAIKVAPLGESYHVNLGEPVLAIGSPMGYSDSVGYGIVTSVINKVSRVDAEYNLVTTDITGSSQGSGVILNMDGKIIGIIAQSAAREDTSSLVTGLSVKQTKKLIQTLTDESKDLIYMGITGESITKEISEKKGIPVGIFTEHVEMDSPAMQVGIQNGDVIVELNEQKVETVKGYQQLLQSFSMGDTIKVKAMRQGTEGYIEVNFDVVLAAR